MTSSAAMAGPAQGRDNLRGILLITAALFLFGCLDATAKHLSQEHHILQIAWARYAGHFLVMAAMFWPQRGAGLLRTRRLPLQMLRSVLLLVCTLLFFTAISFMPLADAVAIAFVSPLLVTALSVPLLKETVGPRRWAAVALGFVGVLIIVRPGMGAVHWAAFLILAMAFCYALFQIITRKLSPTEDPVTTLFYSALVGTFALTLTVPWVWRMPDGPLAALLLLSLGFYGGVGHYLLIKAFEFAPAALLAPLNYSGLLWATFFGYLLFGDFPDGWTLGGAALLIATGIYVLYREGVRQRLAARR